MGSMVGETTRIGYLQKRSSEELSERHWIAHAI